MIRRQERLNGGFYTGLAVHYGQRLQYAKLRGDLNKPCAVHDVSPFRGNASIIHSRTPSGGDDPWAHPFTAPSLDDPQLCYVANGSYGLFRKNKEVYNAVADWLVAQGRDIPCKAFKFPFDNLFAKTDCHPEGASASRRIPFDFAVLSI